MGAKTEVARQNMKLWQAMNKKICLNCGKVLGRNKLYCSQKCRAEYIKSTRKCVICGKDFYASPSSEKKTCSKECEKIERTKNGKNGASAKNMIKAQKAAIKSPNSGRFETNAIAKSWVVKSPTGTVYKINNLSLWAMEHKDILPGTPLQFAGGIRDIKRTMLGKKKRGACQYKGWTLISWNEENKAR